MPKRLVKSTDKKLFGVAGGMAEYFGVDPTLVRVGFVVLSFLCAPLGLIGYAALAILMPPTIAKELVPSNDQGSTTPEDKASHHRRNLFVWGLIGVGVLIAISEIDFPFIDNMWLVVAALMLIGAIFITRQERTR